jgi:5-methylcytosine-specific restriction endonuclease McrA
MATKICTQCKKEKDIEEFHYQKWGKYNRRAKCKICRNKENKKYKRNKEKEKLQHKKYYQKNKLKIKEQIKNYREKNPDCHRVANKKRKYLKKTAKGTFTKELLKQKFDYYGNRCYYCNNSDKLTIEHRIPLSRGGTNWPANLLPVCPSCNSKKGAKTEKEFKEWLDKCRL